MLYLNLTIIKKRNDGKIYLPKRGNPLQICGKIIVHVYVTIFATFFWFVEERAGRAGTGGRMGI